MENVIKSILEKDELLLQSFSSKDYIKRDIKIDNFKIVWFVWLRWVGKTTFLLSQRVENKNSIYISLDDIVLKNSNIFEIIKEIHKAYQISTFYLDEIQSIDNWQDVLKNIYDFLNIKIIFSGSSMIDLLKWSTDLSRRVITKNIHTFTYKEFENVAWNNNLDHITLNDLLGNNIDISKKYSFHISQINFKKYLEFWQFGYYFEYKDPNIFKKLLQNSIKKSIYEDLVKFVDINSNNISKIENLLGFVASSASSEITVNSLSKKVWLNHITTSLYLEYLEKLWWIVSVNKFGKVSESTRKEKKFYLTNTNLLYLFSSLLLSEWSFNWNLRETFVMSNLFRVKEKYNFEVYYKSKTDFILIFKNGGKAELEIWWKNKKRDDVIVVKDDILIWDKNTIPIYLFWFLN